MDTSIIIAIIGSGGMWAAIQSVLSFFMRRAEARRGSRAIDAEAFEVHGKALRGLLYGELERRCTAYIRAGGISAGDMNSLRKYYYEPYKSLNGDGVIDSLMSRVEALPILEE